MAALRKADPSSLTDFARSSAQFDRRSFTLRPVDSLSPLDNALATACPYRVLGEDLEKRARQARQLLDVLDRILASIGEVLENVGFEVDAAAAWARWCRTHADALSPKRFGDRLRELGCGADLVPAPPE